MTSPAWSFDRIMCDGSLGDWSLHTSMEMKSVVMNLQQRSTYLNRNQSLMLLLRNEKGQEVGFVAPWNGIQFFPAKRTKSAKYIYDFKSDSDTWFTLDVTNPKTKFVHSVSCKLSF